jgi:hypothetical protein
LPYTEAKRNGQAERSGKRGVRGVSLDYGKTRRLRAQKKAKLSGHAERSGEGRFGGLPPPTAIEIARTPKKAKPKKKAARPSTVEKGGLGVSPDYCNPTCTRAEESQAERSGRTGRIGEGGLGSPPPAFDNPTRMRAEESSGQAERRRKGGFGCLP